MPLSGCKEMKIIRFKIKVKFKISQIIIPDTAKEKPQIGEIIAVGTDEDLQELVKIGDKILYAKYGGTEVDIEDKKLLIISRSDILAVIE